MTSRPAGGGFGTFDLNQPDALGDGPNQPHDESANWRRRLGWSSTAAPIAMLLAAGLGVGPAGINLLTPATLALLDPAVPIALAALGVLVGLGVGDGRAHNWRLVVAACSDSAITLLVVALGIAAIATKITPGLDSAVWMLVSASGICAATSLTLPTADPLEPRAPSIRVVELGVLLPIVIGGVFLSYVRTDRSIVAGLVLLAQSGAVILAVAVAGWLLLTRASSETEERVIVVSALLLGGGAAAALGQSTLLAGLASGLLWRFAGRRPRETISRDVSFVQHPLLVLGLLVAGAAWSSRRCRSAWALDSFCCAPPASCSEAPSRSVWSRRGCVRISDGTSCALVSLASRSRSTQPTWPVSTPVRCSGR